MGRSPPSIVHTVSLGIVVSGCGILDGGNLPPEVHIVRPTSSESFELGDTVEIVAEASDPDGAVTAVSFFIDGALVRRDHQAPFSTVWNTAGSTRWHPEIVVEARDDDGAVSSDRLVTETGWVYDRPEQIGDGWETASLEDVDMAPGSLVDLVNRIRDAANPRIHGIAVVRRGKLVFETYFDGLSHPTWGEEPVSFDRDTYHVLSSVAKSYTMTLLGIAIEQGFIDSVEEGVMGFFPELADLDVGLRRELRLRHLATMSSGLEWDEATYPLDDERNDLTAWLRAGLAGDPNLIRRILGRDMVAAPGVVFNYSGGSTNVVGEVIHRATGMMVDDFATEFLFEPLGIPDSWWWRIQPDFVYVSGDVAQRPRDMLKLGQMYLQGGMWQGSRFLSEEWIHLSATAAHEVTNPWYLAAGYRGYTHGWWTLAPEYGPGAFTASGWGGQKIAVLPAFEMVIALTAGAYWEPALFTPHEIMTLFILPSIADG